LSLQLMGSGACPWLESARGEQPIVFRPQGEVVFAPLLSVSASNFQILFSRNLARPSRGKYPGPFACEISA
jgi:hypothetical protein